MSLLTPRLVRPFSEVAKIVAEPDAGQLERGRQAAENWLKFMQECTPEENLRWMSRGLGQYFCALDVLIHRGRETQDSTAQWVEERFTGYRGQKNRSLAVVEEAAELALASQASPEEIRATIEVPIRKNAERGDSGDPREEAADVQICLWAYGADAGFLVEEATDKKMELNRSRPASYYAMKTAEKEKMGMPLTFTPTKPDKFNEIFESSNRLRTVRNAPNPFLSSGKGVEREETSDSPTRCECRCHTSVEANKSYGGWFCRNCSSNHPPVEKKA